jgi:hypothetical protein
MAAWEGGVRNKAGGSGFVERSGRMQLWLPNDRVVNKPLNLG